MGRRTLFANSSIIRITPGVNVRIAAAPFLWAAPFPPQEETIVVVPFRQRHDYCFAVLVVESFFIHSQLDL